MEVYLITNLINGKQYIGQTIQPLRLRWNFHVSKASGCLALKSAINKYGKENFKIETLEKCDSVEELNRIEQEKIAELNTLTPNGYNLTTGGERPKYSEDIKKKMSQLKKGTVPWNKGLTKNDKRISAAVSRMNHAFKVKFGNISPRKDTKTSEKALINLRNGYSKRFVKVECIETGEIFESIKDAALALKIRAGNISKNIRKQTPTVGGFTFRKVS